MRYEIQIDPVAKPRMTLRDKWAQRPCVMRYWAFADRLREAVGEVDLSDGMEVYFTIAMPCSWSRNKRLEMDGQPHRAKPDTSNLLKAVEDALCKDDSVIWRIVAEKRWGQDGRIVIRTDMGLE